uniref:Gag-pol polyprotein n=1 Tax=Solanum tuberosum TaxID=4113 RepID=M1DGU5_SOLTU
MNPPSFTGSSTTEDPKFFVEELQKVFEVMHVADAKRVELAAYQLKNRATSRGDTSGEGGGENHLYAITSRQEQENSPDVVTGMIKVFTLNVYDLLDPGASLSFVTPYVAMKFDVLPEKLWLHVLEQRAEYVPSATRQVCLAKLRLQFLRSFQPFCSFFARNCPCF